MSDFLTYKLHNEWCQALKAEGSSQQIIITLDEMAPTAANFSLTVAN